jgi:HlyD family secretion protein
MHRRIGYNPIVIIFNMNFIKGFIFLASGIFLVACQRQPPVYQGYVAGEFRYIASNFQGVLKKLAVRRGDYVQAGQHLFTLDPLPESAFLAQATAAVQQAQEVVKQSQANFNLTQTIYRRQRKLIVQNATSVQQVDISRGNFEQARAQLDQALAQLKSAQAQLLQANWSREQKTIFSPTAAEVFDTYYLPGESVSPNHPVVSLLAPQDIKIVFFIPEKDLSRIRLRQTVTITCDGCSKNLAAINYISPQAEYTPPVIYSNETRDTLVFKIEARVSTNTVLHPGQPVSVFLN